eukprot:scaffold818_cov64-Phaeocystis_antarctica.AAC.14
MRPPRPWRQLPPLPPQTAPAWSKAVTSAASEAASSSTRGSGWAPGGPAYSWGCPEPPGAPRRALKRRRSRAGALPRGGTLTMLLHVREPELLKLPSLRLRLRLGSSLRWHLVRVRVRVGVKVRARVMVRVGVGVGVGGLARRCAGTLRPMAGADPGACLSPAAIAAACASLSVQGKARTCE